MLTSTPKKAVSSKASLSKCLICAESHENNQRIAVFGRWKWDLTGTISIMLGLAADMQRIAVCLQTFSTADED